jgi:hypothetical protein
MKWIKLQALSSKASHPRLLLPLPKTNPWCDVVEFQGFQSFLTITYNITLNIIVVTFIFRTKSTYNIKVYCLTF